MDLATISDDALVLRVAGGDASALETLYERYVRQCYGLALRIVRDPELTEEVVQEVFLKLWRKPESYSVHKGKFGSWILSLVHHRCIDELRRRSRTEVSLDFADGGSVLDTQRDPEADPGDQVSLREEQEIVRGALAQLAPAQREVLELAYFGGLSQSQIASKLNQPLGTVKTRVRSGLHTLRSLLEKQGMLRE